MTKEDNFLFPHGLFYFFFTGGSLRTLFERHLGHVLSVTFSGSNDPSYSCPQERHLKIVGRAAIMP